MSYVSYILLRFQHSQLLSGLGGGQGVRPLHQGHDKVAGINKNKFLKRTSNESDILMFGLKLYYNKRLNVLTRFLNKFVSSMMKVEELRTSKCGGSVVE